jgi:hypothetical protein
LKEAIPRESQFRAAVGASPRFGTCHLFPEVASGARPKEEKIIVALKQSS